MKSKGRSSSTMGLTATDGTDVARLERGADISEGGELGVTGDSSSWWERCVGVVMADTYLRKRRERQEVLTNVSFTRFSKV